MDSIQICTVIPDTGHGAPQMAAAHPGGRSSSPERAHMAMATNYMWKPGTTIRVRLLGGSSFVRKMVKKYASVWLKYANLNFDFVESSSADIRVSFNKGGSWSVIGTSCHSVPKDKPTMNFGWFNDNTPEAEFSKTVTHEFGHALGCIHEHQSPAQNIPWNKTAVYAYYKRTQGWSRAEVQTNIFQAYSVDKTQFSSFDSDSIMLYAIPSTLTRNGYSTAANTTLSRMDKRFIETAYPRRLPRRRRRDSMDTYTTSDNEPESDDSFEDGFNSEDGSDLEDGSDSEDDADSARLLELEMAVEGTWRGHYYYRNGATDGESVFNLYARRISGSGDSVAVDGNGRDAIGRFTIQGRVDTWGQVSFTKSYARHTWGYSGTLNESSGIMRGRWGGGTGTFRFNRR